MVILIDVKGKILSCEFMHTRTYFKRIFCLTFFKRGCDLSVTGNKTVYICTRSLKSSKTTGFCIQTFHL